MSWSVQSKITSILLPLMVLAPLGILIILESKGSEYTSNILVGVISIAMVLLIPFSKGMSWIIALGSINELDAHCRKLRKGDYGHETTPPDVIAGHDFISLKRNMHWMGYAIATREKKLADAMKELTAAKQQIEESLEYASLIQTAFLPGTQRLREIFPRHFLLREQRESVGGDSYWFKEWGTGFFLGVIDCTGHGVPGAFMTLIVQSLLERNSTVVSTSPAEVLGNMNRLIKEALGQDSREARSDDGMDCVLCYVDPVMKKLTFAGANTPLYVADRNKIRLIKGDRCGLGYVRSPENFEFTDHELELETGMRIYIATDGITDQVGGKKGFPFGKRRLMRFMEENMETPITDQKEALKCLLAEYQGDETRRDDVTVLGFEII